MRQTTASRALEVLQTKTFPVDVPTVMISMPNNTCQGTVSRALRRMRAKGIVSSKRNGGRWVFWSFNSSQPAKVQVSTPRAKGLAGRRLLVCRPDNMPTLCDAIDSTVKMLVGTKTEFSAFDVTKNLRDQVRDDAVSIDQNETGTVHVGDKDVVKIDHETIKEVVHDLFQRGEMTGYDRTHNGTHWVYAEAPDDPIDDSDDGDDDVSGTGVVPPGNAGTSYDGKPTL